MLTAGCARVPAPPYPLNFSLDGSAPHVLEASQEVAIPLTVANTGERPWDPGRMHVSYHWLWLVPRETIARSRWNAPYHDGVRSELPGRVAPGERAAVDGRLLAPPIPGFYWLQWDMVEEGASWFAQHAPRQPRTLVFVYPPIAWLFAPLPLLVALIALKTRSPNGDVWWCAAVLFAKPLMVFHDALLEPTTAAYWLSIVAAVAPPVIAWVVLPRRFRIWALIVLGLFVSTLILGDILYYRFFGDLLSAPAILGAHQTSRVAGSIRSLVTRPLAWLIVDWPIAIVMALRIASAGADRRRAPARASVAAAIIGGLAAAGLLLSAPRTLASMPVDQMFRNRSVAEEFGPLSYHAYDAWNYARATWLRPPATDAQLAEVRRWFESRADERRGPGQPGFAAARGRNLIVVQVESLQDFVVDYRVGAQDVMPHLRAWSTDSLRFTNVTDQTNEGRTSDAEFTTLASLLPLDHGAVAFRYPGNHYVALPRVLTEHGYSTLSAVAFEPGFWNRQVMHPSYGFQRSLFESDFQLTEQIGWGLNDRDFLQQMVPRIEQLPRPFAAWMITLSLHHPFDSFPDAHKELKLGALEGTPFGNYLHTMRFFDNALDAFKASLARTGLLDESIVVVFGDHDAGFPRDRDLARAIGIGSDEASWMLNDRIPLVIRVPHPSDPPDPRDRPDLRDPSDLRDLKGSRAVPAGQTDFAPTLLALLGIDAAPLPYVGRNLLGVANGPVVRPYGGWIDRDHLFLTSGASAGTCFEIAGRRATDLSVCRDSDAAARHARETSRLVVADDLQQRMRTR